MKEQIKSELYSLSKSDIVKGCITAIITVIITGLYNAINEGKFPTDIEFWKNELLMGLGAGLSYLIKNFLTNSEDKMLTKEQPKI